MKLKLFGLTFVTVVTLLTASFINAKEPLNLNTCKQQVIQYYQSHQYAKDVSKVVTNAMRYLKLRLAQPLPDHKKPAIVLDIDETSLSNYQNMVRLNFGGSLKEIRQAEMQGNDPVLAPTLKLFRYAKEHHVTVIFITGRDEDERAITVKNLHTAGYRHWDELFLRRPEDHNKTALAYKSTLRKKLADRYHILLNMGDQVSDLQGGYADKAFKLPNPFYYIP